MKIIKMVATLIMGFGLISLSYAGNGSSGGGSGIICFSSIEAANEVRLNRGVVPDKLIGKIRALQSLDLQIAFMKRDINGEARKLYLAKKGQTVNGYLNDLLLRLEQSYPEIAHAIKIELGSLQQNIFFRLNSLHRVLDENDVGTEDSDYCTLTNFMVQYTGPRGTVIHIDGRLYNHPLHSTSSKAIFILHEYIYSVLRKNGATDSRVVRDIIIDIL